MRTLGHIARYCTVGLLSALIHTGVLLAGEKMYLEVAPINLLGFLLASLWSYLAHGLFTFSADTGGGLFPRRWLAIQINVNILLALAVPTLLSEWAYRRLGIATMVLTPTMINYLIWSLAARHSRNRQVNDIKRSEPLIFHADDLGLDSAVNDAIFQLHDFGALTSSSIMVTAPAAREAVCGCNQRPKLELSLHLVLSEGKPAAAAERIPDLLNSDGLLRLGFSRLILLGFMPRGSRWRRRIEQQISEEIRAQITCFQSLFPSRALRIDGHQHIHLTPVIWQLLQELPNRSRPVWIRTLHEPLLCRGVPFCQWWRAALTGGAAKWLVLQLLNIGRASSLRQHGIATNSNFIGLLFAGRMGDAVLIAAKRRLSSLGGLVLIHPSDRLVDARLKLSHYPHSKRFYNSRWRQLEKGALMHLTR